jgi:predicted AlkP superfamily phosphohydrolase/phosphomutase
MKTFVIGLDGATFDLINPFIERGYLPTLKGLMKRGSWSQLQSTIPPVTASAWTSFMTGKNPGAHGLFDFMRRKVGSYDLVPVSTRDRDGKTVWELIGESGKKVIVMGVPVTYPPEPVNGLLVTGMLTPRGAENYTYPSELRDEIRAKVGDYIVYADEVYSEGRGDIFLDALFHSIDQRAKTAEYLLKQYEWDFAMLVYPETDTASHGFWASFDDSHHQHNPVEAAKFRDGILKVYERIDDHLGEIVAQIPEDTTVIIMSDHGHGPVRNFLYVNNFLKEQGWLRTKDNPITALKNFAFKLGLTPRTVYAAMLRVGLGKVRRTLDKRRGGRQLLKRMFLSFNDVDWARTRAYSIGYIGEVHINLKGREPLGIVEAGPDYERLRDEIIISLRGLRLPDGKPLVTRVWKKEEVYRGKHLADAPDILFLPDNLETIAFGDFEFGSNRVIEPSYGVSSSHRMNGSLIMAGPEVKQNAMIHDPSLIDLAPTILHTLGLAVPPDMDGRVLTELFTDSRKVEIGGSAVQDETRSSGYSDEEEEEVVERLRDLGYIS